jgi:hypothetical protein
VAEHDDALRAVTTFLSQEGAAERRLHAEQRKEIRRDLHARQPDRLRLAAEPGVAGGVE